MRETRVNSGRKDLHCPKPLVSAATENGSGPEDIGGDYYDAFETAEGLVCYAIADVSGKGVSAAQLMATLRASLRSHLLKDRDPVPALVAALNNLLFEASSANRYATLFLMLYEPGTGHLTYVNAGHNPPLLVHDGQVTRLECGGPVVGLLKSTQYEQGIVPLARGDRIVAFTDGVTEAVNPGGEEWGEERLERLVLRQLGETASDTVDIVVRDLAAFRSGTAQRDDITILVLQRR